MIMESRGSRNSIDFEKKTQQRDRMLRYRPRKEYMKGRKNADNKMKKKVGLLGWEKDKELYFFFQIIVINLIYFFFFITV